ncbi:hypothetical protein EB796_009429 [Bugula neritina]|uniref:Uncharacterized protein n=1 Tax=Bugula neritina TaxID=10212 RepID=A0A7J7K3V1_BUGNE|nr:hypothetical protein EB796_009429 [Bugula neritina]
MVPPHSQPAPPVAAAQKERDRQVSESAADKESLAADSKSSEGVKSEKIKDEDTPTSKSKVQPDPFSDNPEPQANGKRKESGGSEARPLSGSSDDKRFSTKEDAAGSGKPSRSSASSKSDRRDDRKGSRVEDRTSKSKHADQDGYRSGIPTMERVERGGRRWLLRFRW